MNELILQPVGQNYLHAAAHILSDATSYKQSLNDPSWGEEPWTIQRILEDIAHSNVFYIAIMNEKPVSVAALTFDAPTYWNDPQTVAGYVSRLAVHGDYRGRHVGAAMIHELDIISADHGALFLRLDVHRLNKGLQRYYESLNFNLVADLGPTRDDQENYVPRLYQRAIM